MIATSFAAGLEALLNTIARLNDECARKLALANGSQIGVRIDDHDFSIAIHAGSVSVLAGRASAPDVSLEGTGTAVLRALWDVDSSSVTIRGDVSVLNAFRSAFVPHRDDFENFADKFVQRADALGRHAQEFVRDAGFERLQDMAQIGVAAAQSVLEGIARSIRGPSAGSTGAGSTAGGATVAGSTQDPLGTESPAHPDDRPIAATDEVATLKKRVVELEDRLAKLERP